MRNRRIEFLFVRRGHQLLEVFEIVPKTRDALFPSRIAGRRRRFGPIALGPLGVDGLGIASELEDVPLRDTHMFEELPCCVGRAFDLLAAELWRETAHGFIKTNVRAFKAEQIEQMFLQGRMLHLWPPRDYFTTARRGELTLDTRMMRSNVRARSTSDPFRTMPRMRSARLTL